MALGVEAADVVELVEQLPPLAGARVAHTYDVASRGYKSLCEMPHCGCAIQFPFVLNCGHMLCEVRIGAKANM